MTNPTLGGMTGPMVAAEALMAAAKPREDGAGGYGVGGRGPRHAGHDHVGDDGDVAEAPFEVTDQGGGEFDQAPGDAPVVHQRAGQQEERHRQEQERVHPRIDLLRDGNEQKFAGNHQVRQRHDAHAERHRHAQDKDENQQR